MIFSVLLVVRNEERHIGQLLEAVLNQDFSYQDYEIIVVDGCSTDRTPMIILEYLNRFPERIVSLKNEKMTLSAGWNLGIQHSSANHIIRLDGHSHIPNDFLLNNYKILQRVPEATCVGGIIQSVGFGFWGEVNSYVYSHPFGVGKSMFRIIKGEWEGYVDTVPYGAYNREIFNQVGYFDESLRRNEDLEMHSRIRSVGGKFYLSSSIKSTYFVRSSLSGMIRKSFADGRWTLVASRKEKGVLRSRHFIPFFSFMSGLFFLMFSFIHILFFYLLLTFTTMYMAGVIYSSFGIVKERGLKYFLPCIISFISLHVSRGAGSAYSVLTKAYWKRKKFSKYSNPSSGVEL